MEQNQVKTKIASDLLVGRRASRGTAQARSFLDLRGGTFWYNFLCNSIDNTTL
jgi:hypothetical protein